MENFYEYYYCLNIIVSINSFSALNITINTTMKYYQNQALNKKLKLIGVTMKFIWKKLLCHEILALWSPGLQVIFEKFVKPCGLFSYIYLIYAP